MMKPMFWEKESEKHVHMKAHTLVCMHTDTIKESKIPSKEIE